MAPRRLVIFDCDGTLVDSQHIIVAAMDMAFGAHGVAIPTRDEVLSIVGLSLGEAVARLAPAETPDRVHVLAESYKEAFGVLRRDPANQEPLYPGIADLVAALSARDDIVLGIATGKSRRGVAHVFDMHDLHPHFMTIQTADTHPSKPHPSMVLAAMAEAEASPEDTVMIGDTTFDIEMARAAGVHALGVTWGYHPPLALSRAGAHAVADDCDGLAEAIAARFQASEAAR